MSHALTSLGLVVATALLPAISQAQGASQPARRPLQLEDFYRIRTIGSPAISPDGRWVLYTVSTPVEETNGSTVETWIVSTDGSTPAASVRHQGRAVTMPRWSDEGRVRYTDRDAVWTIDPSRPSVAPVASQADDRLGLRSPDGRWLARTRSIPTPPRPEPEMTEFERRHEGRFKGTAFDWYPFRQDGRPFPIPDRAAQPTVEVVIAPTDGAGAERQLTQLGLEAGNLRWTADSRAILFTANASRSDELAYGVSDIFRVDLDGNSTRLTDDGHNYSGVEGSPDGRWYSYVRSLGTDLIIHQKLDHGGAQDLFVQATSGGPAINLTERWDLDAGAARWSPGSRYLYFTAGIGGAVHLFRVAAAGGAVEQITTGARRISGVTFDRGFRKISYAASELDRPADLYVADIDGRNERRLTDVNRDLVAEVVLTERPSERITWKSYDGTEIEGFLLFPRGYDPSRGPYPLIIVNHGGPHAASGYAFDFKQAYFAANGYLVFLPNFRSSTGYGDAFKWATWGGWGNKDGEDVVSGIDHLVARYAADPARVGSTGHSYGGILTNWLITKYPERFRAAVSGAGESNWTSNFALSDISRTKETEFFGPPWDPRARAIMIAQSPVLNAGGVKAATLFIHGAVDYRVPLEGAIQLYTALKKQRVPTKLIIYEGQAHGITGPWNNIHRIMHELRWWDTYLAPPLSGATGTR